jgi:hypothetical protein
MPSPVAASYRWVTARFGLRRTAIGSADKNEITLALGGDWDLDSSVSGIAIRVWRRNKDPDDARVRAAGLRLRYDQRGQNSPNSSAREEWEEEGDGESAKADAYPTQSRPRAPTDVEDANWLTDVLDTALSGVKEVNADLLMNLVF